MNQIELNTLKDYENIINGLIRIINQQNVIIHEFEDLYEKILSEVYLEQFQKEQNDYFSFTYVTSNEITHY